MNTANDVRAFLEPTAFIDSDAASVVAFARRAAGDETSEVAKAVRLYYAVRDTIVYTPGRTRH